MDIRKVKKLIELLEESGIAEIEIKEGEEAVRIKPHADWRIRDARTRTDHDGSAGGAARARPPHQSKSPRNRAPMNHVVTAPMVGTFYAASTPGAKAFVDIGDEVKVGQVLCIIEAMR